jgi:mannose-6-phosphate isomerase-like protein (cupin superfamily)
MEFININEIKKFKTSKIIKQIPIITAQLMATALFIDSSIKTPANNHERKDEILYIVKGKGKLTIEGKTKDVKSGMMVLIPKTESYSFSTVDDQLIVLSFKNTNDK